ncbi:hypothetical protein [Corallococcus llansteffanensis]|uniref:Uncharacterized protein n=1 Tax=Corallococcus llansteffanensis TaxID=2316731 RepID=A0A3A8NIL2_9BACT|nr:hypothetical protein [Corallococcus llansteffanensis]RKH43200.1 hypothetical protein D7V93_37230 [Corallococcus llansteffanensis]
MAGVNGVGGGGNVQQARSSGSTDAEKTKVVTDALSSAVTQLEKDKGSLRYLGDSRIEKMKTKVTEEMATFIKDNPKATKEEIKAQADKVISKHQTNTLFEKIRDDNFFKNLMNRRKELLSDMWG